MNFELRFCINAAWREMHCRLHSAELNYMIDPYRQLLNEEKLPWKVAFWVIFIFAFFCLTSFVLAVFGLSNLLQSTSFSFRLIFWLLACFVFGGAFILLVKFTEYWDETLIDNQNEIYFTSQLNTRSYFEITKVNPNHEVDYAAFFTFLHHASKAQNYSKETDLNKGKKPLSLFFDFVAHNGVLKIYAIVSGSKVLAFQEAVARFFPEAALTRVQDPIKPIKDAYKKGSLDINDISGFAMGLNQTNLLFPGPVDKIDVPQEPIQNLLKNMIHASQNRIIYLQYGFIFGEFGLQNKYQAEFDEYAADLTTRYLASIEKKDAVSKPFYPVNEKKDYNALYKRLHNIWFMTAIRVMAIDKTPGTYTLLEHMMRSFIGRTNLPLDIVYLTSTKQEYFKYTKKNRQPEPEDIYRNMYYPDDYLEQIVAPLYNKYYYPKESYLRRGTILRSMYTRNPMSPWHPKFTNLDPEVIKYYFCLGV
jgi:hypothetical protein